jgi:hypothetical protein
LDVANLTVSVGPLLALAPIGRLSVSLSGGLLAVNGQDHAPCTARMCSAGRALEEKAAQTPSAQMKADLGTVSGDRFGASRGDSRRTEEGIVSPLNCLI